MPSIRSMFAAAALLASAALPTRAAESYDNCVGFIDTLPATIATQGVWCLRADLGTSMTDGAAITINTNNVTIDCNHFKLGGLAAGAGTAAAGIHAINRLNTTVRNCSIRGFAYGVAFTGTAASGGHVIEDNRFDGNTYTGIHVEGDGSVVRRNQVIDTGGATAYLGTAYGLFTEYSVDVLDNTISGVLPSPNQSGDGSAVGIYANVNLNGSISGNRVRGLVRLGTSSAYGIYSQNSDRVSMDRNHVVGDASSGSIGLRCSSASGNTRDNIISGFATAIETCASSGNMIGP
ncbi:MAG TPA: right-handed parallel beta-helix repeat-containing protein [Lysobacter sp.]